MSKSVAVALLAVAPFFQWRLFASQETQAAEQRFLRAEVFGNSVTGELRLRGVSTKLKLADASGGWVKVTCDKVSVGSQGLLGLRIAVLPRLEVSGMKWLVYGEAQGGQWTKAVIEFFQKQRPLAEARIRDFSLTFESFPGFELQAGRAEFDESFTALELRDGVVHAEDGRLHFSRGLLFLHGERSGDLEILKEMDYPDSLELPISEIPSALRRMTPEITPDSIK